MAWTVDPLEARRAEQQRLLDLARAYVVVLAERIRIERALVAGSVARGDFNVWSDVDLVIVSDELPAASRDRDALLDADRPGRVEVHGYTSAEFGRALERGDALAREAAACGLPIA